MGRGGRSAAAFAAKDRLVLGEHILETTPLKSSSTEELRQHAKDRGLKTDGTREDLLIVLHPFSKVRGIVLLHCCGVLGLCAWCASSCLLGCVIYHACECCFRMVFCLFVLYTFGVCRPAAVLFPLLLCPFDFEPPPSSLYICCYIWHRQLDSAQHFRDSLLSAICRGRLVGYVSPSSVSREPGRREYIVSLSFTMHKTRLDQMMI